MMLKSFISLYMKVSFMKVLRNLFWFRLLKLVVLVLTTSYSTSSVERSFSALKRIKIYLRNTPGHDRLSNLWLMSIEKSLLKKLMFMSKVFYDNATDHFCKKHRGAEFVYQ